MEFRSPLSAPSLSHCPIHGPQALVKILADSNFLKESKIYLKDDENGEPIFDEYQVTYAPEERLFYKNEWQENLIPQYATPEKVKSEFQRFFQLMDDFRKKKDSEGKFWFDIPIKNASTMDEVKNLEKIIFKSWLLEHQFHSDELFWYLDYCCKDDFGLGIAYVSAYAGIHYFAARKQNASEDHQIQCSLGLKETQD